MARAFSELSVAEIQAGLVANAPPGLRPTPPLP